MPLHLVANEDNERKRERERESKRLDLQNHIACRQLENALLHATCIESPFENA